VGVVSLPRGALRSKGALEVGPSERMVLLFTAEVTLDGPSLWSSVQSFWLQIQRFRVRFPPLPDFLRSKRSGTGSTQPWEDN
jgi:hypothetical protein